MVLIKNILVPDLGGLSGLEIIDIFVSIGETTKKGDPIVLVETEKASMEIVSDFSGEIIKLHVSKGLKISTGMLLADIEAFTNEDDSIDKVIKSQVEPKKENHQHTEFIKKEIEPQFHIGFHAGPAVRKLARELGINLNQVLPTGLKNRVTLDDIKKFARDRQFNQNAGERIEQKPKLPDFSQWGLIEEKKLNNIKMKTAENMLRNWNLIPHVTHFDEADITSLEEFRAQQQLVMKDSGIKISPLIFVMKAVAQALKDYHQLLFYQLQL